MANGKWYLIYERHNKNVNSRLFTDAVELTKVPLQATTFDGAVAEMTARWPRQQAVYASDPLVSLGNPMVAFEPAVKLTLAA